MSACSSSSPEWAERQAVAKYFPLQLGESASQAKARVLCPNRRILLRGDEWVELDCPELKLPGTQDWVGRLQVKFQGGRVVEQRWERILDQPPVEALLEFDRGLRADFRQPILTNRDPAEDPAEALARGEWHSRWWVGGGTVFSWFALREQHGRVRPMARGSAAYTWVLALRQTDDDLVE
jgi:hypothetical protein